MVPAEKWQVDHWWMISKLFHPYEYPLCQSKLHQLFGMIDALISEKRIPKEFIEDFIGRWRKIGHQPGYFKPRTPFDQKRYDAYLSRDEFYDWETGGDNFDTRMANAVTEYVEELAHQCNVKVIRI